MLKTNRLHDIKSMKPTSLEHNSLQVEELNQIPPFEWHHCITASTIPHTSLKTISTTCNALARLHNICDLKLFTKQDQP